MKIALWQIDSLPTEKNRKEFKRRNAIIVTGNEERIKQLYAGEKWINAISVYRYIYLLSHNYDYIVIQLANKLFCDLIKLNYLHSKCKFVEKKGNNKFKIIK